MRLGVANELRAHVLCVLSRVEGLFAGSRPARAFFFALSQWEHHLNQELQPGSMSNYYEQRPLAHLWRTRNIKEG